MKILKEKSLYNLEMLHQMMILNLNDGLLNYCKSIANIPVEFLEGQII